MRPTIGLLDSASVQDERILNERRQHRDRPFDVQRIASSTLDDLE
jgi:ATP-dependent DNA helicase RecG